jgi:hypothetical protein
MFVLPKHVFGLHAQGTSEAYMVVKQQRDKRSIPKARNIRVIDRRKYFAHLKVIKLGSWFRSFQNPSRFLAIVLHTFPPSLAALHCRTWHFCVGLVLPEKRESNRLLELE